MELIVAVYDDWGIGRDGTQPVALKADRKFFRETTRGAMVIVGRRTIGDFPGQKPLPGRVNVALTRAHIQIPGFTVVHSPEEAAELAKTAERAMVIGDAKKYLQNVVTPVIIESDKDLDKHPIVYSGYTCQEGVLTDDKAFALVSEAAG